MTKVDALRNEIIEKILCIENKKYLHAISNIVENKSYNNQIVKLTKQQKLILNLSDRDIQEDKLIGHDVLMKKKHEWLKGK